MSDAVKLALINQLPAILAGAAAFVAALVGVLNHFGLKEAKVSLQEVKHELNSVLAARVKAEGDSGRIAERTEQRQADLAVKSDIKAP